MRAFIAVFPPAEVQQSLHDAAKDLFPTDTVRIVSAANIHLTLKFLGEIPPEELEVVKESLSSLSTRHEPFDAQISGFGAFPTTNKARILWAGIEAGAESFRSLAHDVEASLGRIGFRREPRSFKPHLTLGRVRKRSLDLDLREESPVDLSFHVGEAMLVRSLLERSGPVYETLAAWPLGTRV